VRRFVVTPKDFGFRNAPLEAIAGGTPHQNALAIQGVLEGRPGTKRDVVVMNAAAALVVSERARDFREAAEIAGRAISAGLAQQKLQDLVSFTS